MKRITVSIKYLIKIHKPGQPIRPVVNTNQDNPSDLSSTGGTPQPKTS